jgi:hypothetical protein
MGTTQVFRPVSNSDAGPASARSPPPRAKRLLRGASLPLTTYAQKGARPKRQLRPRPDAGPCKDPCADYK